MVMTYESCTSEAAVRSVLQGGHTLSPRLLLKGQGQALQQSRGFSQLCRGHRRPASLGKLQCQPFKSRRGQRGGSTPRGFQDFSQATEESTHSLCLKSANIPLYSKVLAYFKCWKLVKKEKTHSDSLEFIFRTHVFVTVIQLFISSF